MSKNIVACLLQLRFGSSMQHIGHLHFPTEPHIQVCSQKSEFTAGTALLNPKGKGNSVSNGRNSNPTAKGVKVLLASLSSSRSGTSGPLCRNNTSSTQYKASSSMIPLKPSSKVDTTPIRLAARLPHMAKATRPPSSSPNGIMLSAFTTRPAQPAKARGFRSRLCLPASCPPRNSLPAAVTEYWYSLLAVDDAEWYTHCNS